MLSVAELDEATFLGLDGDAGFLPLLRVSGVSLPAAAAAAVEERVTLEDMIICFYWKPCFDCAGWICTMRSENRVDESKERYKCIAVGLVQ